MQKKILFTLLFMVLATGATLFADEGYVPEWNIGDRWILEASYRDMRSPGEVWLPPLQWIFRVRNIKEFNNQPCYVIHIFPANPEVKVQAVLWLAVKDLRPLKVIDIYPVHGKAESSEKSLDPSSPQPLIAEDTLIPYDLPVFPLIKPNTAAQNADGFDAYRSVPEEKKFTRVKKLSGFSFKRTVAQKSRRPEKQYSDTFAAYRSKGQSFQVELAEPRSDTSLIQLWQEGSPWAILSESAARKVRLLPPAPATPPESRNGGNEQ